MTADLKSTSNQNFLDALMGPLSSSNVKQTGTSLQAPTIRKNLTLTNARSFTDVLLQKQPMENHYSDENNPMLDCSKCVPSSCKASATETLLLNGIDYSVIEKISPTEEESLAVEYETVDVHETYQLGYCNSVDDLENSSELYIFDFVDGLEVSYPISIPSSIDPPLDLPILFLQPDYIDQLAALASSVFNGLTQVLNDWLLACQHADEKLFVWEHVVAHEEAVLLRKHIIDLLDTLIPHHTLLSSFDVHSPRVDQFLSRLITALTTTSESLDDRSVMKDVSNNLYPVVSLCPDPHHCLSVLRSQIVLLLRTLLPQLILPQSFDSSRDLSSLLSTVRELNQKG